MQFNCKHRCTLYSIHLLPALRCPRSRSGGWWSAYRGPGWYPCPVPPPVLCRTLATPCLVPSACWLLAAGWQKCTGRGDHLSGAVLTVTADSSGQVPAEQVVAPRCRESGAGRYTCTHSVHTLYSVCTLAGTVIQPSTLQNSGKLQEALQLSWQLCIQISSVIVLWLWLVCSTVSGLVIFC